MDENKVIFNTGDYDAEDNIDFLSMDIGFLLDEYIRNTSGEVKAYAVLSKRSSRYGYIGNNGAVGYNYSNHSKLENAILSMASDSDRIIGYVNEDGELQVNYYDHDGVHQTTWSRVTRSRYERFRRLLSNYKHQDIVEYIQELPKIEIKSEFRLV